MEYEVVLAYVFVCRRLERNTLRFNSDCSDDSVVTWDNVLVFQRYTAEV